MDRTKESPPSWTVGENKQGTVPLMINQTTGSQVALWAAASDPKSRACMCEDAQRLGQETGGVEEMLTGGGQMHPFQFNKKKAGCEGAINEFSLQYNTLGGGDWERAQVAAYVPFPGLLNTTNISLKR